MARVQTTLIVATLALLPFSTHGSVSYNPYEATHNKNNNNIPKEGRKDEAQSAPSQQQDDTRRSIKEADRLAKLRRMRELIEEEMAELDARDELASLEDRLAHPSSSSSSGGVDTGAPTALASGTAVLDIDDFADDHAKTTAAAGITHGNDGQAHHGHKSRSVGVGASSVAKAVSYRLGLQFAGTLMPYPLPSWMSGVHSYVTGMHYTPPPVVRKAKRVASSAPCSMRVALPAHPTLVGVAEEQRDKITDADVSSTTNTTMGAQSTTVPNKPVSPSSVEVKTQHGAAAAATTSTASVPDVVPAGDTRAERESVESLRSKLRRLRSKRNNAGGSTSSPNSNANTTDNNTSTVTIAVVPAATTRSSSSEAAPCFERSDDAASSPAHDDSPKVEPRQAKRATGTTSLWWVVPLVLIAAVAGTVAGCYLEGGDRSDDDSTRRNSVLIESGDRRDSLPLFGTQCSSSSFSTQHTTHTRARGTLRRCSDSLPL